MKKQKFQFLALGVAALFALYLALSGCNKQLTFNATDKSLQAALKDSIGAQWSGNVQLRVTANNEVLIVKAASSTDTVRNALILQVPTQTPVDLRPIDLGYTTIYTYKDNQAVLLHSMNTNNIYFLGLAGKSSNQRVASMEKDKNLAARLICMVYGFGLVSVEGKWAQKTILNADKKFAINLLVIADLTGRATSPQRSIAITDQTPMICVGGGVGYASCSLPPSTSPPSSGCSATCSPGWFACCDPNNYACTCQLDGTGVGWVQERWGQCGGMGYTGPNNCLPGNACVFINPYYSQCQ